MKGIVFEIKDGKAVLLKNDGGFVSVKAGPGWETGEVVSFKQPPVQIKKLAALAAGIALVLSLGLSGYGLYYTPVSLVSVDINPSLEISLNRFDRVVGASSHNTEGGTVLENLNIRNMQYTDAMELLMQDGYLGGYLGEGGYLVVTVQSANEQKQELMLQNLQSTAETAVTHHGEVYTEYYAVDRETVAAAHEHGVTAGKYMVLMELQDVNPSVDIQEYSHCSVAELKEQIDEHSSGRHEGNGGDGRHRDRHH